MVFVEKYIYFDLYSHKWDGLILSMIIVYFCIKNIEDKYEKGIQKYQ